MITLLYSYIHVNISSISNVFTKDVSIRDLGVHTPSFGDMIKDISNKPERNKFDLKQASKKTKTKTETQKQTEAKTGRSDDAINDRSDGRKTV